MESDPSKQPEKEIGRDEDGIRLDLDATYTPVEENGVRIEEIQNAALEDLHEVEECLQYGRELLTLIEDNKNIISKKISEYTDKEMEIIEQISPYLSKARPENLKTLQENVKLLQEKKEMIKTILDETLLIPKIDAKILQSLKETTNPNLN